jgi:hypothetical protein
VWQWSRYLCLQATADGKRPLLLNLDETAVPVVFTGQKGTVMVENGAQAWRSLPRQQATKAELRMYFTHVAIICNEPHIQPLLPQVIFVGASVITLADLHRLQATLPNNVFLKRMPKGWNNSHQHCIIMRILGLILAPFMTEYQPILMVDAAPLHLTSEVLTELREASIWFLLVPAKMTWLLQPCDTHVFSKYKRYLKQKFTESAGLMEGAGNKAATMIQLVVQAIRHVLQANVWQTAFQETGMWRDQTGVSAFILSRLEYEAIPILPDSRPTADMLRACWPRNRIFLEELVMSLVPSDGHGDAVVALPLHAGGPPAKASGLYAAMSPVAGVAMVGAASGSFGPFVLVPAAPEPCPPVPVRRLRTKTTLA